MKSSSIFKKKDYPDFDQELKKSIEKKETNITQKYDGHSVLFYALDSNSLESIKLLEELKATISKDEVSLVLRNIIHRRGKDTGETDVDIELFARICKTYAFNINKSIEEKPLIQHALGQYQLTIANILLTHGATISDDYLTKSNYQLKNGKLEYKPGCEPEVPSVSEGNPYGPNHWDDMLSDEDASVILASKVAKLSMGQ